MGFKHDAVLLVGGGDIIDADLALLVEAFDVVIAADGGADTLLRQGYQPDAVIGDFDSISQEARQAIPSNRMLYVNDQDSTDLEKCLAVIDANLIVGFGFFGDRLDHTLATQSALIRFVSQPVILVDRNDVLFLCPPKFTLDVPPETRVSCYPVIPVIARSEGLFWPLEGLTFSPQQQIATSNRALGTFTVCCESPGMLVIMEKVWLSHLIRVFLSKKLEPWSSAVMPSS